MKPFFNKLIFVLSASFLLYLLPKQVVASSTYTLYIRATGNGTGTIEPCSRDRCFESYPEGTRVTLTPSPASGSIFSRWAGACSSIHASRDCQVIMNRNLDVYGYFDEIEEETRYWLVVEKTGFGSGTIASNSAGINCGSDCLEFYDEGNVVTLTATPLAGSVFTGWSGSCTGTGSCQVTMDAYKKTVATFEAINQSNSTQVLMPTYLLLLKDLPEDLPEDNKDKVGRYDSATFSTEFIFAE